MPGQLVSGSQGLQHCTEDARIHAGAAALLLLLSAVSWTEASRAGHGLRPRLYPGEGLARLSKFNNRTTVYMYVLKNYFSSYIEPYITYNLRSIG